MNREIKFRIWDNFNKEMVTNEVYFHASLDRCGTLNCTGGILNNIAMQFTGLKDKNGIDIYEGDILIKDSHTVYAMTNEIVKNSEHTNWYKVFWNEESSNWSLETIKTSRKGNFGLGHLLIFKIKNHVDTMEVIGNIHEHPNLLK